MTEPLDWPLGPTYRNPVHDRPCPDPFVLKFGGEYWAYCTDFWHDGRVFGVLHSRDLVHWRELNGALEPLPEGTLSVPQTHYWAPEVVCDNGRFLMYYSVGNEARMEIRVAVAERPSGPFVDAGRTLTREEFAIDAHVFVDDDGTRYLFYATDFLAHAYIGTGTVIDRMLDPFTLAGQPHPVTRARFDWQVYDPQRKEKGGVRWHTVEGPAVVKHKGLYYEMFSGGNWQNTTYGVSYATTPRLDAPDEWEQYADGARVLPILRTIPGKVTGPGHNSIVRGPDNRQLFCVYHLWTGRGRVLAIDRLDWAGERMLVLGPTTTPQPAPLAPAFADFFDGEEGAGLGPGWLCEGGRWRTRGGEVRQEDEAAARADAGCDVEASSFVIEVDLRAVSVAGDAGACGLRLVGEAGEVFSCLLSAAGGEARLRWLDADAGARQEQEALPEGFDPHAFHLLRLEFDAERLRLALDGWMLRRELHLCATPRRAQLSTVAASAAFKGFTLTVGWESLFEGQTGDAAADGWRASGAAGEWTLGEGLLRCRAEADGRAVVTKGPLLASYELVVNARLCVGQDDGACGYGFYPAVTEGAEGPAFLLRRHGEGWALECAEDGRAIGVFPLPHAFDPSVFQHFRFTKREGRLAVRWENELLSVVAVTRAATRVGLCAQKAEVSFDLVRVTMIKI